jgi:hypothetical protein
MLDCCNARCATQKELRGGQRNKYPWPGGFTLILLLLYGLIPLRQGKKNPKEATKKTVEWYTTWNSAKSQTRKSRNGTGSTLSHETLSLPSSFLQKLLLY